MANNNQELEILKAQMAVLKNHLSNEQIVSDEMVKATVNAQAKSIATKRNHFLLGLATCAVMIALFGIGQLKSGLYSMTFMVITTVWILFFAVLNIIGYCRNDQDNLLGGSLTETAKNVLAWRKRQSIQGLLTAIMAIIWVPVCIIEIWDDVVSNPSHGIIAALIIVFALYSTISNYSRTRKSSKAILDQINEISK